MRVAQAARVRESSPDLDGFPFLGPGVEPDIRLTERQRKELERVGTRMTLRARSMIYSEGATADSVFAVVEGAVKAYRVLPSGKRTLSAFLFHHDIFGLAERGRYLNSTQAITRIALYRFPREELIPLIKRDGDLQFVFLGKVTHELRDAQRRAVLINRRDAVGRLAMFLRMMRRDQPTGRNDRDIPLPMTRTDIADFLGLSREALSRAASQLERRGLVRFVDRHTAHVVDTAQLAKIAAAV